MESSALVDVEEELGNLRNSRMMQMVLQYIDVVAFAQSGISGQVIGCRESSESDGTPRTSEAEYGRRCMDATHG